VRSRWWTPRAISAHVTLAVCEPGFGALAWWQVDRALGGNSLSWVYVFEWPFFGVYAVFLWWRIVHDQPLVPEGLARALDRPTKGATDSTAGRVGGGGRVEAARDAPARLRPSRARRAEERARREERELAAYNRYLASLSAEDPPKRW